MKDKTHWWSEAGVCVYHGVLCISAKDMTALCIAFGTNV